jgi:GSH-dependent disulfide-bond oxidoreductase|tara:strand:+ start:163 stop:789 length:627 start_codon:yes stop_codon:yes gene_type:complete
VIELFYSNTPNGKKISIMLEEIKFDYKITQIDLSKGDQFNLNFRKISPLSKIPAIIDHKNKVSFFQSGAILIYLAELSGQFYDTDNKNIINQWLMAQISDIGPMLGQHHQFHHYNPGKSKFGEDRYFNIAKRLYKDLDEQLSKSDYIAGKKYSIADIATFPWIARHKWHDIGLKNYKSLSNWYEKISKREAVKRGFDCLNTGEIIPEV